MAFDFSKLDSPSSPEERAATDARRAADRRRFADRGFAGREMRRIAAEASSEIRHEIAGGFRLTIVTPKGRAEAAFSSAREEEGGETLREHIGALWRQSFDAGQHRTPEDPILAIELDGIWKPRRWKDRQGATQTSWEFHVARWTYADASGAPVEGGWLPDPGQTQP